ncbi:MAG: M50 family metallopeptidase [Nitriliruptor sp.]|uniref:RIP metalloprotease n=1 Tax=Nitriliruptor sp. TaxID=2448056 RepID=UPI0034A06BB7
MSGPAAITVFVVSLIAAIMLHEAGHLLTARRFGMRADRFFLGFGPTLWSTRRGETEYGVKALPLGGFVRIRGMSELDDRLAPVPDAVFSTDAVAADRELVVAGGGPVGGASIPDATWDRFDTELRHRGTDPTTTVTIVDRTRASVGTSSSLADARDAAEAAITREVGTSQQLGDLPHRLLHGDRGRFFADRPAWQRAIVLAAGSAVHFLIAIVLLLAMFLFTASQFVGIDPTVTGVLEDSPAEAAGLQVGDELVAVEGTRSGDYEQLRDVIRARPGEPIDLTVIRDGVELTLTVTPRLGEDPSTGEEVGQVGFVPTEVYAALPPGEAIREAFTGPVGFVTQVEQTFVAIGRVFGPEGLAGMFDQATGAAERDAQGAVSIVGAAGIAGQAAAFGIGTLLLLIASINVFIGIFNLLPLPPLDGGHLAVLGIERAVNAVRRLRGRTDEFTVDPRAIAAVMVPVLVVLGFVFVTLTFLDITQPIRL